MKDTIRKRFVLKLACMSAECGWPDCEYESLIFERASILGHTLYQRESFCSARFPVILFRQRNRAVYSVR